MEFLKFVRKPFMIEAVQITEENMDELCKLIGHEVRPKGDTRFIVVNKHIVPNGYRAYVGWWVTKMGDNLRCYPNRVFIDQFIPYGPEWESWFEDEDSDVSTQLEDEAESTRTVLVFDAEAEREKQAQIITVTSPPPEETVTDEEARVNDEEPLIDSDEQAIAHKDAMDNVMKDTFEEDTVKPYEQ
jgi:hypothetical protein